MNKLSQTILLFILNSFLLHAQPFSIGIEMGASSTIETDFGFHKLEDKRKTDRRNALFTGLNMSYSFSENLSLETGVGFLRQGLKHKTCNVFKEEIDDWYYTKRDYLMIPLSVNIAIQKKSDVAAILGLFVTRRIDSTIESPEFRRNRIGGCGILFKSDVYPNTYKNYLGGIVGFKFKLFEVKQVNIYLKAKYYQSLGLISENRRSNSILLTLNFER